jgi:hypothetical protein
MKWYINKQPFNSDKEAEAKARDILYSDNVNTLLNANDFSFMVAYFKAIHWEWKDKNGIGIAKIKRVPDPYGKRCFQLIRLDNTITDISFIVSRIKKSDSYKDMNDALRHIISIQITDFKRKVFENIRVLKCPILGIDVTEKDCHIDHYNPTFEQLVINFKKENGITDESKLMAANRDNQMRGELIDQQLQTQFYRYHKTHAKLRAVSKQANLSHLKRK